MHYGLELPCGGDGIDAALLVQLGVDAEQAGWDGVFFEDYLVYYRGDDPPTFDPWLILTAVALRTRTVRLGTTVTGLLHRDPVQLARQALTLRDLSGGRAVLGVGLGDPADRGTFFAREPGPRGPRMDERLGQLLDLLAGRPIGPEGVVLRPGGGVPVWVGGSAQAGAVHRRAARADGIVPYQLTDTDSWSDFTASQIRSLVHQIGEHRSGAEPFDVAVGGRRRLHDEEAERRAVSAAQEGGATWWLEFVAPGAPDTMRETVLRGPVRS
ncbi:LLM class flavin-dependent oxidoreductase [Kineosporia sp. NBRC 101731]|uniref:LLM class flavin-dependent oxidoreductase n=1 Tax=Kineosporia sp. NBRC 101731 TaxID=3032199 RepID=UPI0024A22751|nr:LLM class flavin-dependent oxidoreductase [Kineosporia sp. NBRC 101731]GLY29981.1 luciferase-like protein [Kineosporia sp. NBRC 101731]